MRRVLKSRLALTRGTENYSNDDRYWTYLTPITKQLPIYQEAWQGAGPAKEKHPPVLNQLRKKSKKKKTNKEK